MNIFIKMSSSDAELKKLEAKFKEIDIDCTGMLTGDEIKTYLQKHHRTDISRQALEQLIDELDTFGNGRVNYSEFLAATINARTFFTENKLRSVFSMFDTDNTGKITNKNMINAFSKLGYDVPESSI